VLSLGVLYKLIKKEVIMTSFTQKIPSHMFNIWSKLFDKSGGFYNYNPQLFKSGVVWVDCSFENDSDYNNFMNAYNKIPESISETKRSKLKTIKMRFKYYINKLI
tara:strand:- start:4359 stop:4673 length:315 start_codon:yes stop_codon:yes gene_type:complete